MRNISFMPWTGGKFRVVDCLYPLFPDYSYYYEPFFGSGAVLINKQCKGREKVNDLDRDLYTLHKVMKDREQVKKLIQTFQTQPLTEEAFKEAKEKLNQKEELSDFERARCKYLLIQLSYNGMGKHYSGYNGKQFGDMVAWKFPIICDRYQNVEFRNVDGISLMGEDKVKYNSDAFIFADPPYVLELRGNKNIYQCDLTDEAQVKMLETIQDATCKIMLCGYAGGGHLYDKYLFQCGQNWRRYKLADLVHSCSNQSKKGVGEEFIWVNYELPESAGYYIDLSTEVSTVPEVAA